MKSELETAIKCLTKLAAASSKPLDAMQYAQAALNLTQALASIQHSEKFNQQ